ncbi:MAG: FkbM family methyltransferase [Leptolyngbyaceae cyanobacterium SU_3_3]|nr:FkbM family methyltransferase [Leptolyngbyaceae cyanobacterium SU_3_3]
MNKINVIDIGGLGIPWSVHNEKVDITLAFEPNEDPVFTGNKLRYNCAVWDFDGVAKFHVYGAGGLGSSLLTQNTKWVKRNFESIKGQGDDRLNSTWFDRSVELKHFQCQVKQLDTILNELDKQRGSHTQFHFLKSDTQSGESFVLDGARHYLDSDCLGLDLELFVILSMKI